MKKQLKKIIKRALKNIDLAALLSFETAPAISSTLFTPGRPVMALRAPGPKLTPNLNTILLHLCDGNFETAQWILRWLAFPLRNPGAKMATALWLRGGQGSGKDLIFSKLIAPIYGLGAGNISHGLFNGWSIGRRYVVVNEFDAQHISIPHIKTLISAQSIFVEQKGKPPLSLPNRMNFVFLSGAVDALKTECTDRRWLAIDVPPALPASVYASAALELHAGASQIWLQYLVSELEMGDFNTHTETPRFSDGK